MNCCTRLFWPERDKPTVLGWACIFCAILALVVLGCGSSNVADSAEVSEEDSSTTSEAESGGATVAADSGTPPTDAFVERTRVAKTIVAFTNRERRTQEQPPLRQDSSLARIACRHNQDMLAHGYMGHEDVNGQLPTDRVMRNHRSLIGSIGENVYKSATVPGAHRAGVEAWAQDALDRWRESPGHRKNLLRKEFTHTGVCVTHTESVAMATQMFAGVWAYLDTPLPRSVPPGDSLAVSVRPITASGPPVQYAFVPVGEPVSEAFTGDGEGRPFRDRLYLPDRPGVYGSRFLFPEGDGRYRGLSGPRVRVE